MPTKTESITCNFVGDFEVADNIARNAASLTLLDASNADDVLNKLIVIQAGSIVEVCLAQIIYRAQNYNREGVPNISEEDRLAIASATIEKFNNIIQTMKKYKILDGMAVEVYDELHKMRKYRNKVHIQEDVDIPGISRREDLAFTEETTKWSLRLMVSIVKYLNEHIPRPAGLEQFARTITVPSP